LSRSDKMRDRINCGAGFDIVFANRRDRMSDSCERVRYPRAGVAPSS
jgi:hypothetical protein